MPQEVREFKDATDEAWLNTERMPSPSGRIEMPAGSFDGVVPIRNDGGSDAGIAAPVREPELVSAGRVRGETGPGPVNSIVEDAPVRTETGGAGESTVVREPSTETGGGSSHAGGESGGHGGSDTGNGGGLGRGDDGVTGGEHGAHGRNVAGGDVIGPEGGDSPASGSSTPASPGRVYSLMDGSQHTTSFAPEDLGGSRVD